jgi:hypothetical protein
VGVIAAGIDSDPFAKVQVVSIQTALSREIELNVQNLFLDEAHHFIADEYRLAANRFHARYTIGATATPERSDGRPLGDLFSRLVVPTSYSELIRSGYLVPARILRPDKYLDRGLALKVIEAYIEKGENKKGFVYCRRVEEAHELCDLANKNGIKSRVVEAFTDDALRKSYISELDSGKTRLLWNVYALTEGVDVPSAELAVFARKFGHISIMLQAAGRILRPANGKREALILDLAGITHILGLPIEDREYSLTGQGIAKSKSAIALKVCLMCGMTFPFADKCPRCGFANPVKDIPKQRIYNEELRAVYSGSTTPDWAKASELERLKKVAKEKGLGAAWIQHQYKELFHHDPQLGGTIDTDGRRAEFDRLTRLAKKKNYKSGWVQHRYRVIFGTFPPRDWVMNLEERLGENG